MHLFNKQARKKHVAADNVEVNTRGVTLKQENVNKWQLFCFESAEFLFSCRNKLNVTFENHPVSVNKMPLSCNKSDFALKCTGALSPAFPLR